MWTFGHDAARALDRMGDEGRPSKRPRLAKTVELAAGTDARAWLQDFVGRLGGFVVAEDPASGALRLSALRNTWIGARRRRREAERLRKAAAPPPAAASSPPPPAAASSPPPPAAAGAEASTELAAATDETQPLFVCSATFNPPHTVELQILAGSRGPL